MKAHKTEKLSATKYEPSLKNSLGMVQSEFSLKFLIYCSTPKLVSKESSGLYFRDSYKEICMFFIEYAKLIIPSSFCNKGKKS